MLYLYTENALIFFFYALFKSQKKNVRIQNALTKDLAS